MRIASNTFLVSGGGSGLGAATVRRLSDEGANVFIIDIDEEKGSAVAADLGKHVDFAPADVTDEDTVLSAIDVAQTRFGHLHGAINCAGVASAERVIGRHGLHDLGSFRRTVEINLIGTFNMVRLAADVMAQNQPNGEGERGVIVNTSSVAAFDGQIGQVAYAASKGGIVSMTLPMARDLAPLGIRAMTIAPGIFDTPLLADLPENARQSLGQQVPFPSRLGRPTEFASLVTHIIENPMLNGEVIRLDGAIRMGPR